MFIRLQEVHDQVVMSENQQDKSWWCFHSSGKFSAQSFMKHIYEQKEVASHNTSISAKMWKGVAPLKAELLLWFILLGRLNTNDRLYWLNILRSGNDRFVLCNAAEETISHLFFTCNFSWKVWCWCCESWGIS